MSSHDLIDMSAVPVPDSSIQQPNYELRLTQLKAQLLQLDPALEDVLALESEPLVKVLEAVSPHISPKQERRSLNPL